MDIWATILMRLRYNGIFMKKKMGLHPNTKKTLDEYNKLIDKGFLPWQAVEKLAELGFRGKSGASYSYSTLLNMSKLSGYKMNKLETFQTVLIHKDQLKLGMILTVKYNLNYAAEKTGINRETLRVRLKKRYPLLYKNKGSLYLKFLFFKNKDIGSYEESGFILDLKYREAFNQYTLSNNGSGYLKISNKYFHRMITRCPDNLEVDHINMNNRDNRVTNLRICTRKQNCGNKLARGYAIKQKSCGGFYYEVTLDGYKAFKNKDEARAEYIKRHIKKYGNISPYLKSPKI